MTTVSISASVCIVSRGFLSIGDLNICNVIFLYKASFIIADKYKVL